MRKIWLASVAVAALALAPMSAAVPVAAQTAQQKDAAGTRARTAAAFVDQALASGEKEVAAGRLAQEKSQDEQIRQFSLMIVADHTRVNEQLRKLQADQRMGPRAGEKSGDGTPPAGVAPGAAPTAQTELKELQDLSGAAFDRKFMVLMVEDHQTAVELYERASTDLPEGAAKALAADTLPKLRMHLDQAKALAAKAAQGGERRQ